jgi:hypothetical protein
MRTQALITEDPSAAHDWNGTQRIMKSKTSIVDSRETR